MRIFVLYGSESGNAEMLADDVADVLKPVASEVIVRDMADTAPEDLIASDFLVVVCSTYGEGELPDAASPFRDALLADRPDFGRMEFSVFGLGDSSYETFNNGSLTIASDLVELGAVQVGRHGVHDASAGTGGSRAAVAWAGEIAEHLQLVRERSA